MPIESLWLRDQPPLLAACPLCGWPFDQLMRRQVQSWWRRLLRLPYCAVICRDCKEVVGWEKPQ